MNPGLDMPIPGQQKDPVELPNPDIGVLPTDHAQTEITPPSITGEFNNPKSEWYPFIDYYERSSTGIAYYMYHKIRMILAKLYNSSGYPVRFRYHPSYFSYVNIGLPDGWVVHSEYSANEWYKHPSKRWRSVVIYHHGQELMNLVEGLIPLQVESALINAISWEFVREYPMFENLIFFNTINDILIFANWDKILMVLNENGY